MRVTIHIIRIAIVLMLLAGTAAAADAEKEKTALAAAEKWIALVDKGKYTESWDEAASTLRNAITKENWQTINQIFRASLGDVISRKLKETTSRSNLPGGRNGEFVIIRFKTSFENMKSGVETVTQMLDKDGKWRVCGYLISSPFEYLRKLVPPLLFLAIVAAWFLELKPEFRFFRKDR